jgi:hypothetical protein
LIQALRALLLLGLASAAGAQSEVVAPKGAPEQIVVKAGRLIDPKAGTVARNVVILVEGGKVARWLGCRDPGNR